MKQAAVAPMEAAIMRRRRDLTLDERVQALERAGYNVSAIPADEVAIDLETDGGASAWSASQLAALCSSLAGRGPGPDELEALVRDVYGYPFVVPCAHGRAAESLFCQVMGKMGTVVLGSMVFPTTFFHHFQNLSFVVECATPEAYRLTSEDPFQGNLDLDRMAAAAAEYPGRVAYVWIEPCCNAAGGHPVSIENLRQVRDFARRLGVPVVMNGTRLLENAYLIQRREPGYADRTIREIVRELCDLTDACVMSAAKDLLVDHGGLVACRDEEVHRQVAGLCFLKGAHISDVERALLVEGMKEAVHDPAWIPARVALVERFHDRLAAAGLPVLRPAGGHAVYLDAKRFLPHVPLSQLPSEALAAYIYRLSGVRTRPGFLTEAQQVLGVRLLRLAVPPRRYTREDLDAAADAVIAAHGRREQIQGLCPTRSLAGMASLDTRTSRYRLAGPGEWAGLNWSQVFWERIRQMGPRTLLIAEQLDGSFVTITWGALGAEARAAAAGLCALGLRRGDRVALLCENSVEWIALDAACLALGVVTVPIYPSSPPARVARLLEICRAKAILCSGREQVEKLLGPEPSPIERIVVVDRSGCPDDPRLIGWSDLVALGRSRPIPPDEWEAGLAATPLDATATIMYTSGTTGVPSGVIITQGNLLAAQLSSPWPFFEDRNNIYPLLLDLNHVMGRGTLYTAIHTGYATVIVPRRVDVDFDPTLFELYPPSLLILVPRVIERLAKHLLRDEGIAESLRVIDEFEHGGRQPEARARYGDARVKLALRVQFKLGGRLLFIGYGGAALAPTLRRFFKLAGVMLGGGYGMTECGVISADLLGQGDTVGRGYPYVEMKTSTDGEILVRGPAVSPGYLDEPERNRQSFEEGGWFRTGDRGEIDALGFLKLTGRIKDIHHLSDGSNIFPSWIEGLLSSHPLVRQAVLIGDERPHVTALLAPDFAAVARELGLEPGAAEPSALIADRRVRALFEAAIERLNIELAPPEQIRGFTLLAEPFPADCVADALSRTKLRVDRTRVDEVYRGLIEAMYA